MSVHCIYFSMPQLVQAQSINQPINQSISQPISKSINQSINQSSNQSIFMTIISLNWIARPLLIMMLVPVLLMIAMFYSYHRPNQHQSMLHIGRFIPDASYRQSINQSINQSICAKKFTGRSSNPSINESIQ